MKFLFMQLSAASCHFIPPGSEHSPQDLVLRYAQCVTVVTRRMKALKCQKFTIRPYGHTSVIIN
jgi:hypothetical protein